MGLSLIPEQRPEHRMQTVTIDEIISIGDWVRQEQPPLENYFSPTKREHFIKDYIHFQNTKLLDAKHGHLDKDMFLMFVLSFQFTTPLLKIHAEKELGLFYRILQKNYNVEEPDLNMHFKLDEFEEEFIDIKPGEENVIVGEEEALESYRKELEENYEGFREVKESVQDRLKQDGISSIMQWQKEKDLPSLAEAFGRSIVIPSFFSYSDKKLINFYKKTTEGISYEVMVPEDLE